MCIHVSAIHSNYSPAKPELFLDFSCISFVTTLIYRVLVCLNVASAALVITSACTDWFSNCSFFTEATTKCKQIERGIEKLCHQLLYPGLQQTTHHDVNIILFYAGGQPSSVHLAIYSEGQVTSGHSVCH